MSKKQFDAIARVLNTELTDPANTREQSEVIESVIRSVGQAIWETSGNPRFDRNHFTEQAMKGYRR